jgi:hypothetical protein
MTIREHTRERGRRVTFAAEHGQDNFRPVIERLRRWWDEFRRHYPGTFELPGFDLEGLPPRSLAAYDQVSGDGVQGVIRVQRRIALGSDKHVLDPTSDGFTRFLRDCLLHSVNHQYAAEVLQADESAYNGFGPAYAREANRVTALIQAEWQSADPMTRGPEPWGEDRTVTAFRRNAESLLPVARNWPFCLRPDDYYGRAIAADLEARARGGSYVARRKPQPPTLCLVEYLLRLHREERFERATGVLSAAAKLLGRLREARRPALRRVEQGQEHPDGRPLDLEQIVIDPTWLRWENGLIAKTVEGMAYYHSFAELPILADMLTDAGCADDSILEHCRMEREHSPSCWVVAKLLAAAKAANTNPQGE